MAAPASSETIAAVIQLAVAPVFLLTGIGSVLNVLTARLGRVIDRSRAIETAVFAFDATTSREARAMARDELRVLDRRMASSHLAIAACTLSILLVCVTIAILFVGEIAQLKTARLVAILFVAAMGLLISGLLFFLYELRIALQSVRVQAALLKAD